MEDKVKNPNGLKWEEFDPIVGGRRKSVPARRVHSQHRELLDDSSLTPKSNGLSGSTCLCHGQQLFAFFIDELKS